MQKKTHKREQGFIGIIIVIIIVALFSGGLYYYLSKQTPEIPQNTKKSNEEAAKSPEVTPSAEEELTPSPEEEKPVVQKCTDGTLYSKCSTNKPKYCDNGNLIDKCSLCSCPSGTVCENNKCVKTIETPGWKTHRTISSGYYGFEIKYPEKWLQDFGAASVIFSSGKITEGSNIFYCSLEVNTYGKGVNAEKSNSLSSPKENWKRTNVDINGNPAIKLTSIDSQINAYYFLENSNVECCSFEIHHHSGDVEGNIYYNQECMDIFNQMLSTFKFLN